MIDFKNNLIKERKKAKFTQTKLAEILGINQQTYAHYESGNSRPKLDRLALIAKALKIKVDILLE